MRLALLTRTEKKELNQTQVQQQPEIQSQNITQNEKLSNINQQMNTSINSVQQVQQNDCVFLECNPMMDHISHEQTNFISVHQQHQPLGTLNYGIPNHNQIQIGSYTLQNVAQVQVYNGTYPMPLQPVQCSQMQVSKKLNN